MMIQNGHPVQAAETYSEEKEVKHGSEPVIQKTAGKKENLRWIEVSFQMPGKVAREVQVRKQYGREFQTVGAAKEKERLPKVVRRSGIVRRLVLDDRRLRDVL